MPGSSGTPCTWLGPSSRGEGTHGQTRLDASGDCGLSTCYFGGTPLLCGTPQEVSRRWAGCSSCPHEELPWGSGAGWAAQVSRGLPAPNSQGSGPLLMVPQGHLRGSGQGFLGPWLRPWPSCLMMPQPLQAPWGPRQTRAGSCTRGLGLLWTKDVTWLLTDVHTLGPSTPALHRLCSPSEQS